MDTVSPALALVDPDLRAAARLDLPFPGDCLTPSMRATGVTAPIQQVRDRSPHRPSLIVAVASLLVASIVASPVVEMVISNGAPEEVLAAAPPSRTSADRSRTHELRWPAVRGAQSYVLTIIDTGGEVVRLRRKANHVWLGVGTALDGGLLLRPGTYEWSVLPAFDDRLGTRNGRTIARGRLVLDG